MIRVLTALMLGYTTLVSAFTSSIFSTATITIAGQYHVSAEVGLLGLSFYVLGFAIGPMFWAPLSELRGRRLPLVISMFGFTIFQIAVAVGKDLQTILLCRFWGGWCLRIAR
jgi:DHA1 family multidrug resistance protein-like MFS transporter